MPDIVMPIFLEKEDEELLRENVGSVSILSNVFKNAKRLRDIGSIAICSNSEDIIKAAKLQGLFAYYTQKVRCDNVLDSDIFNAYKVMDENDALNETDILFIGWRNLLLRQETISRALDIYKKEGVPILTSIRRTDKDPAFSFIPIKIAYRECFKEGKSINSFRTNVTLDSSQAKVVKLLIDGSFIQRGKNYHLSFVVLDEKDNPSSNVGWLKFNMPNTAQGVSFKYDAKWLTNGNTASTEVNINFGFSGDTPQIRISVDTAKVLYKQNFMITIAEEVSIEECDVIVHATTEPIYCVDTARALIFNREKGILVIGRQDCSDIYELAGAFTIVNKEAMQSITGQDFCKDIYGYEIAKPDDFELFNNVDLIRYAMLQGSMESKEHCKL